MLSAWTRRLSSHAVPAALWLLLAPAPACRRQIGDGCRTNIDCAFSNDRICDITQREGYCTVAECSPGSCPDQATCVEFEAHTPRLARRFCAAPCEVDTDCRGGYRCERPTATADEPCPGPEDPGAAPPRCTRVVDPAPRLPGFCTQVE